MRILIGSDYFYPILPGGGEKRMYEIGRRLAKNHEVHVITRKLANLTSYEKHENMYIHRVYVPSKRVALESFINGLFFMGGAFFKSLDLGRFDVYAPQNFFPVPPVWMVSKQMSTPTVVTIHDVFYVGEWIQQYGVKGSLMVLFEKMTLKLPYTKVITVSNASKEKLVMKGVPKEKIEVIPNGVDLETFDRVEVKKSEKPRIIYVGRLIRYKHVDDLLVAFSRLDLDAELYIVGEGPERKNLEALAGKLRVNDKVTFTGFVSEAHKIKLLKSSHVLVLPSTTEGFGIALVEAMAAKTPVIAADIPALRELVKDGKVGLLFKPRNIDELKAKIERLLIDAELQKKLSEIGYDLAKMKFAWDEIAKEVESLLTSSSRF